MDNCREENQDPFLHDQTLGHGCGTYHFVQASILHFLCPFCANAEYNAPNTWRSDRNDEALLRIDIEPRHQYWTEYVAEQR